MHSFILLSELNDFIFCPRSLYYHHIYGNYEKSIYQTTDQTRGIHAHKAVDSGKYSSRKTILQGLSVVSKEYGILGKIDIFDTKKGLLIERKRKIKSMHYWYLGQLYGQYFCLSEMGYIVTQIRLYSIQDNKTHNIALPNFEEKKSFKRLLERFKKYQLENDTKPPNPNKCRRCIYQKLCNKNPLSDN